MEEEIIEINRNVHEKPTKSKNKLLILIIIICLLVILLLSGYLIYDKLIKKDKKDEVVANEESIYKATIDAYADAVTLAINNYIEKNNGNIPTWSDIENNITTLKNKVSCDNKINYDGSLYLENCTVEGIKYTSNYTYGKKLADPIKSNQEIYIYSYEYSNNNKGYNISDAKFEDDYYTLVDTYKCIKDTCHGYSINSLDKIAIIYDENDYYLYDFNTKKKEEIDLGSGIYHNIGFLTSRKDTYGLYVWNDSDKAAFYNLKEHKFITDFIYDGANNYEIDELLDNNYFAGYILNENKATLHIINNRDGSIYKTIGSSANIKSISVANDIIYAISDYGPYFSFNLYNSQFELLTGEKDYYYYAVNTDNTISVYPENNNKKFYIYDALGNLKFTSKEYKKVVKVVKDYIIILDEDNNLKLLNTNEEEMTTFLKVTDNYRLHPLISGWFTENGKNGIYMVIENTDIPYGQDGSGLEYYYIPSTKETGVIKNKGVGGYAKPVLYLYPTKKTNVTISFEKPYLLTTTYPKYQNNWIVTAYPNGDLYDSNNKYYYGLYWEEDGTNEIDFSKGFYVTKNDAIEFLDKVTEKIGFTRREANEFIMYWLPILEKNEKNLVHFEFTEERNNYNKLIINPTPDSLLRVAIHVKKVDKYTKIAEQKIPTFKRTGFTAIEWGGAEH